MGKVDDKKLLGYYKSADIFVHYPFLQQFEIVNLEAMASGLPIVVSNNGAAKYVVGEGGLLGERQVTLLLLAQPTYQSYPATASSLLYCYYKDFFFHADQFSG